ncbi:MAG TPA: glycoside hydrolase family 64 protein [Capillimicrobium sp.]|jgi:hypothetical protein
MRRPALLLAVTLAACGLGAAPATAQRDGSFPVTFANATDGRWKSSEIFVTGIGQTSPGQWAYLKTDGTMAPLDHTMAAEPGHLTKKGQDFADMSFTLAEASTVRIPPRVEGGRLYVSVGEPMYIGISPDDKGWAGPNLRSKSDPNFDTVFDWYEFTYAHGQIPFGGNTTQVDQFGLPMTSRLEQVSTGYDRRNGITLSRAQVMSRYADKVAKPFRSLMSDERILAPRTAASFEDGGPYGDYLDPAIDRAWRGWQDGFSLTRLNQTFTGKVTGGRLAFKQEGGDAGSIGKPSSADVFQCSGALAKGGMSPVEGVMGAELCAAFNRGVSGDTGDWYRPSAYYDAKIDNDYAAFFHGINIGKRSYAFAYDDINDQSSVAILPNADPPSRLTIEIGW